MSKMSFYVLQAADWFFIIPLFSNFSILSFTNFNFLFQFNIIFTFCAQEGSFFLKIWLVLDSKSGEVMALSANQNAT